MSETESRIAYLEKKLEAHAKKVKQTALAIEEKYRKKFERQARYVGNGVYEWCNEHSPDTRALFLMGVLISENVKYKQQ